MRAADFSWEAPPSPFKTSISSTAIIALQLRNKRHSIPPKSQRLLLIHLRGCLPQSLHSPQFSEPDPIYPYLPFLFCCSVWQWVCQFTLTTDSDGSSRFSSGNFRYVRECTQNNNLNSVFGQYKLRLTSERFSITINDVRDALACRQWHG